MSRFDRLSLALIAVATIRIVATLTVLSATTDEPLHVTAGVELLLQHRYRVLPENPPLPRVVFAAPLVAAGVDFDRHRDAFEFIGRTLYSRGAYRTNLFLTRIGNLLFFWIAALAMWRIGRRELGDAGGAVTTLLFTMQPLILGFSGIANNDLPSVAGMALALLAFSRWLERRTAMRALVFGLAYGFSIGLKFSSLAFVPASCAALYVAKVILDRDLRRDWRSALAALPLALASCVLALWACYGFTVGPLNRYDYAPPQEPESLTLQLLARIDPSQPIPAPHFIIGLNRILSVAQSGLDNYALGMWNNDGWWWYFPLALALKTTLASLLLILCGAFVLRRDPHAQRVFIAWLAAALVILLIAVPSKLDLGVRYILPIYAPLTIAMAAVATTMLTHARRVIRIGAIVLLAWHCVASFVAHPEYFAYFNELAQPDPSRFLVDSNLDWGQDILLLRSALREVKAERVGLALVGMHDYNGLGFPKTFPAPPDTPAKGWIAVSDHLYRLELSRGYWQWLRGRKYRRIGASIRLYYVPPG